MWGGVKVVFEVDLKTVFEVCLIVLTLKIILNRWHPPIQESMQSIIAITLGTAVGYFINPTKDGFILAIIVSSISFYGKDLLGEFTTLKDDLKASEVSMRDSKRVK